MAAAYAEGIAAGWFRRSETYRRLISGRARLVREPPARAARFGHSERHLQCVWFDPALRPAALRTDRGEPVEVEDPGVWNLEAGPDFLGAALRIGPDRRRFAGDVEVHVRPEDWTRHRHAADPRYARVRMHVTYFPSGLPASALPEGATQIALRDALAAVPSFSFDNVDVAAYPFGPRATPAPCSRVLAGWAPDDKGLLLDAAGEERLRRKAERIAAAIEDRGAEQAVYEEVLCALGYKHNKAPFRLLAARVPVRELKDEAAGDPLAACALLMGVAGLLPAQADRRWDAATRAFVRSLWDAWWKRRERWDDRALPAGSWRLAGLRPANHPARRLAAAARLFAAGEPLSAQWLELAREHPSDCGERMTRLLEAVRDPFWDRRLSLRGRPQASAEALIGQTRARAILNNVFVPFLAAQDVKGPIRADLLAQLPAESDNAVVRQTAASLFGPDYPPSLCRSGLRQQGLIQVFHDFCLNDRSRCSSCLLPEMLKAHRR